MNLAAILRYGGWVVFLSGAAIVFFVTGGLDQAVKEPIGWVGIVALLLGVIANIVSAVLRLWPRKPG